MEWEVSINKHKNKILNIIVIIIAIFIANNIYKARSKALDVVRESKDKEIERNKLLDNMSQLDKKIKSYKNFLNKKDISLVINNISSIAKDSGVRIDSVKPEPEQPYPAYIKYNFNFAVSVKDYKTLGDFISKLENSSDVYMIEDIDLIPELGSEDADLRGLNVSLKISTFLFREEKWK